MANRDEGNISRAMSLLREAAAVLTQGRQINTSLSTGSTPNAAEQSNIRVSNSPTAVTTRANASANTPNTTGALRNFGTLFAPYASTNSPSKSRGVSHRPPPKIACKRNENKGKARETWTHGVFCLASIDEEAVPTRKKKTTIQLAGLGELK